MKKLIALTLVFSFSLVVQATLFIVDPTKNWTIYY